MFNLDRAITGWRRQMLAAGIKAPEVLTELESHLIDDFQQQIQDGASEQKAFDAAVQRLGHASVLKAEFRKKDESARLRLKSTVLAGNGLFYLGTAAYSLVTHEFTAQERLLGFAALAFSIFACAGSQRAARRVRVERRTLTAIGVASVMLGAGWLTCFILVILPHLDFTLSQLVVVLLWALVPTAAGGAFQLGLEECK